MRGRSWKHKVRDFSIQLVPETNSFIDARHLLSREQVSHGSYFSRIFTPRGHLEICECKSYVRVCVILKQNFQYFVLKRVNKFATFFAHKISNAN